MRAALLACLAVSGFCGPETEPPPPERPVITGVAPAVVDTGGGESITLDGAHFEGGTPNASVSLGNNQCQDVNVISATQIKCNSPAVTIAEKVDVMVTDGGTSAGTRSAVCVGCLEFKDIRGPKITEFFPLENSEVPPLLAGCFCFKFNEPIDRSKLAAHATCAGTATTFDLCCNCDCTEDCSTATSPKSVCYKPRETPIACDSSGYCKLDLGCLTDLAGNTSGTDGGCNFTWSVRCN